MIVCANLLCDGSKNGWGEGAHNYITTQFEAGIDLIKRKSDMHFFELQVQWKI